MVTTADRLAQHETWLAPRLEHDAEVGSEAYADQSHIDDAFRLERLLGLIFAAL